MIESPKIWSKEININSISINTIKTTKPSKTKAKMMSKHLLSMLIKKYNHLI